jgi:pyrrolidone-carboxylate peptidase
MNFYRRNQILVFITLLVEPMRILVTGFEPFGDSSTNSSMLVVQMLMKYTFPFESNFEFKILPVSERGANYAKQQIESGVKFDLVVHLGLCESCTQVRVETRARNWIDMRIPDNEGRQIRSRPIDDHGAVYSELPFNRLFEEVKSLEESIDAGSFVCNETYRQTLLSLELKNHRKNCVFVHLPSETVMSIDELYDTTIRILTSIIQSLKVESIPVAALALKSERNEMFAALRVENTISGWEFPGGKLEADESVQDALQRECLEELNLKILPMKTLGRWDYEINGKWYALFLTSATATDEAIENIELFEHAEYQWIPIDELLGTDWMPHDRDLARYLTRIMPNF